MDGVRLPRRALHRPGRAREAGLDGAPARRRCGEGPGEPARALGDHRRVLGEAPRRRALPCLGLTLRAALAAAPPPWRGRARGDPARPPCDGRRARRQGRPHLPGPARNGGARSGPCQGASVRAREGGGRDRRLDRPARDRGGARELHGRDAPPGVRLDPRAAHHPARVLPDQGGRRQPLHLRRHHRRGRVLQLDGDRPDPAAPLRGEAGVRADRAPPVHRLRTGRVPDRHPRGAAGLRDPVRPGVGHDPARPQDQRREDGHRRARGRTARRRRRRPREAPAHGDDRDRRGPAGEGREGGRVHCPRGDAAGAQGGRRPRADADDAASLGGDVEVGRGGRPESRAPPCWSRTGLRPAP